MLLPKVRSLFLFIFIRSLANCTGIAAVALVPTDVSGVAVAKHLGNDKESCDPAVSKHKVPIGEIFFFQLQYLRSVAKTVSSQ